MEGLSGYGQDVRADLQDLYQEVIVDHSKHPRFKGKPKGTCQICQEGKNPLCGDELTLFCSVTAGLNAKSHLSVQFSGKGCAISQASASMLCELMQDKTWQECRQLLQLAESTYTGKRNLGSNEDLETDLDSLFGVSKFPVRVKCAALPWKTLELILDTHFDKKGGFLGSLSEGFSEPVMTSDKKKLKVVLDD
jgi:nitrogen fixation protein NifU and related proteins